MTGIITINNYELPVREYNGQRVVTFKDIDAVHQRPEGTARRNFNHNKRRFIEGMDYFKASYKEVNVNKPTYLSIFDVVRNIDCDRGISYDGFIYMAQNIETKEWKLGRTKLKKDTEKRFNLARVKELENYQYFECRNILLADKLIKNRLKKYCVKNSWFKCDEFIIKDIIKEIISQVPVSHNETTEKRGACHTDLTLLSVSGYSLIVKSLKDKFAWMVQKEMFSKYFL